MITLYDIPSNNGGAWSPNTWKARFVLNFKGLPHKTVFVTYPEIEGTLKAIGAKPTGKRPDTGADLYTLPVITDDAGGKTTVVEDSLAIAEYLDKQYPDKLVFPRGTRALQAVFIDLFSSEVMKPSATVLLPGVPDLLDPAGAEYFHTTRKTWYGKSLTEFAPHGPVREKAWEPVKAGWTRCAGYFEKNGDEGPWLTGKDPVFADLFVLSVIVWTEKCSTPAEWNEFKTWDGGRWAKLYEHAGPLLREE